MDVGYSVQEIVRTYDLPLRLQDKIARIAVRRIAELNIGGFDNVYRYVDYLVGRFQARRDKKEKLTDSLDTAVRDDSRTLIQKIGVHDPALLSLTQGQGEISPSSTINEILEMLRGKLSDADLTTLLQLARRGINQYNTSPEELTLSKDFIASSHQVKERLEVLAEKFGMNGRIIIPNRPIIYVQFDPKFYIRFEAEQSPVSYMGCRTPLSYFIHHSSKYKGKTEDELKNYDPELHKALVEAGQLQIAISPKPQRTYGPTADEIIAAYNASHKNLSVAARLLGIGVDAIYHNIRRKKLGLKGYGRSNRWFGYQQKTITEKQKPSSTPR